MALVRFKCDWGTNFQLGGIGRITQQTIGGSEREPVHCAGDRDTIRLITPAAGILNGGEYSWVDYV
jgi:hypothetical protein